MELTLQYYTLVSAEGAVIGFLPLKGNAVCLRKWKWALLEGLQHISYWQVLGQLSGINMKLYY